MSQTKVTIGFDQASIERFARLLGHYPQVIGAHCSDDEEDEGEEKGLFSGSLTLGAHCSDDDEDEDDGCEKSSHFESIACG